MLFLRHARSGERGCHPNLSNMKRLAIALLAAATATACQVDYHPYDTRIDGECGINAKNIARIEASTAGKSAIRFAVISDTQRWYDETREAVSALNARGDIDFVLHTGDMADFGMKAESSASAISSTACTFPTSSCWATTTVWPPERRSSARSSATSTPPSRPGTSGFSV